MIDPFWSVIDLDARTWRNLGRLIDPGLYIRAGEPNEHGLFVFHDAGRTLRVVDTAAGVRRDLGPTWIDDPQALARALYATGEWDRVHVIDKRHLANVAREAQATPRRELTIDQYYRYVGQLLWGNARGYACAPAKAEGWHGWTYDGVQAFARSLGQKASVALGVIEGSQLQIGLLLDLRDGMVRTLTTFEAFGLPIPHIDLSVTGLETLWGLMTARAEAGMPRPGAALLCSATVFTEWVDGAGKLSALEAGARAGAAFWRIVEVTG